MSKNKNINENLKNDKYEIMEYLTLKKMYEKIIDSGKSAIEINYETHIHPFIGMLNQLYQADDGVSYNICNFTISKVKVWKLFNQYLTSLNGIIDNNSLIIGFDYAITDGLMLSENEMKYLVDFINKKLVNFFEVELNDVNLEEVANRLYNTLNLNQRVGG